MGADEVINVVEENVVEKVKEITKEKMAYGAIDCVGGDITRVSEKPFVMCFGVKFSKTPLDSTLNTWVK